MRTRHFPIFLFALLTPATALGQEISFNRDVRPIISDKCFHCHGPDADNQQSDFRLDTREHALEAITEGSLDDSEVHHRIRSEDGDVMPPADAPRKLTEAEKDIIDRWIKAGAPFEKHWSFEPVPDATPVPKVQSDWPVNNIDRFIYKRIADANKVPNTPASKEKWLRKVTFDITGLPPGIDQIEAYLADESGDAEEKIVDQLLDSDPCAERLASEWLDVARYSDSYGFQRDDERYVWPWRDWVIKAFRNNMPYDQFVTWQLAGDLMENPSRDQIVATVFNRLHSHKKEGGVAIEEFRVENVSDRTHTFAGAFMGLTLECARCHDHKYDPTKTKEYYELSSFFANVDENGLISYFTDAVPTPSASLPTAEQQKTLDLQRRAIDAAAEKLEQVTNENLSEFYQWHASKPGANIPGLVAHLTFDSFSPMPKPEKDKPYKNEHGNKNISYKKLSQIENHADSSDAWTLSTNKLVDGKFGKAVALTGDDAVVLPGVGHYGRHQPFSISIWIKPGEVEERAVIFRRSRGWDDAGSVGYELTKVGATLSAKMVHFWPGEAICVETDDVLKADQWHHLVLTYDGSSKAAGMKLYVDGQATGHIVKDHLTRQVTTWNAGYQDLAIGSRYRDRGFKDGQVDEFKVFDRELAWPEALQLFDGKTLIDLLADKELTGNQIVTRRRRGLADVFALGHSEPIQAARKELESARLAWNKTMDSVPAITVMRETETPRDAFILKRGAYDDRGEQVTANVPGFLSAWPEGAPRNRLGLARWITSPDHPLLARVTVNRYWQLMFAQGLVRTPEDFGLQGEVPTHPELLDWLARDFIANGWNVRRLLKQMALSATYRQSAIVPLSVRQEDPENRLLARGPGNRISAEMLRDSVLFVSGQLKQKVGGPPTKPYDVALAYNPLEVDAGDGLYRRSLYTFWKRSSPAPVMMTMDASKRDVCRVKREVTASPLQALVLLNGTQFVEASRILAEKLHRQFDGEAAKIVDESFQRLTSRKPTKAEADILRALYQEQLELFESQPQAAADVLQTGSAKADKSIPATQLAAATITVNAILNLDESVRQR